MSCTTTCPVHVLGVYFESLACGSAPFAAKTPSSALGSLRDMLSFLNVPDAGQFRTHDLRRGHAEDLKLSGENLFQILKASEWRSPAFLSYLDVNELESATVGAIHLEGFQDQDALPNGKVSIEHAQEQGEEDLNFHDQSDVVMLYQHSHGPNQPDHEWKVGGRAQECGHEGTDFGLVESAELGCSMEEQLMRLQNGLDEFDAHGCRNTARHSQKPGVLAPFGEHAQIPK